ncbi:MAG: dTDP-4-dehydrorhamnose 3,5-epimerase [Bacteroidales bacterium]|nr:dTDP-4-dehydrorhamnose 3,5-epimerase [Bacteroidales bacterium]
MEIEKTNLPGLLVIKPRVFEDSRGYFFESYNEKKYLEHGLEYTFVQDNESLSAYGSIRGLHYQLEPHAQTKLVRVITGKIFDVAADIRKNSPTFGQWHGTELSEKNKKQMLIPRGFAHGFSVLSESTIVFYKCDDFYHPESERGIHYQDESLNIDWKIDPKKAIISEKDKKLPDLANADMNF